MVALIIIVLFLVSAVLGIQVGTDSVLVLRAKQFLHLVQPYNKKLFSLSKLRTWWQFTPRWFIILLPIILIIVLILKFHHFLFDLLDCSYCISFHIMWILCYFLAGIPIVTSLVLAPLAILGVYIIERIRR